MNIYIADSHGFFSHSANHTPGGELPPRSSFDKPMDEEEGKKPRLIHGAWELQTYPLNDTLVPRAVLPTIPCIKVGDIQVTGPECEKAGDIWWINKETAFTVLGTPEIPESIKSSFTAPTPFVLMAELVIDGSDTQKDVRFKATLEEGKFKLISASGFKESGNYIIRAERLNEGLERIEAPFRVEFETIEFDVLQG